MIGLCKSAYEEVKQLLKQHEPELRKLSAQLLLKETLDLDELQKILGPRPGQIADTLKDYVSDLRKGKIQEKGSSEPLIKPLTI